MARIVKFSKEYILEKSKEFINKYGIEVLNARDLAKYLGCSTQPLFKNFISMDNYKIELKEYLYKYYKDFIFKYIDTNDYLYTISYAYALFAFKESNIFKALFMSDLAGSRTIDEVLESKHNLSTIESIPKQYNLNMKESKDLYRDVRFFTHGLACQIACNSIIVSEKEIKELILNIIKRK